VEGKLVVNEYEAAQVRKIFEWYLAGLSPDKISERLRAEGYTNRYSSWVNTTSIRNILTSELYLGKIRYGDVVVENAHEALVTNETFEKVKALKVKRRELFGDSPYQAKYLLVGMVFCARCGARYHVKHNYAKYKYYVCYSRAGTIKRMIKADHCDNKNWRLEELEARIVEEMEQLFGDPLCLESLLAEREKSIKNKPRTEDDIFRDKIKEYDVQISHLMDLYQNKDMPANIVSARIEKLYSERTALDEQLHKLRPDLTDDSFDPAVFAKIVADAGAIWAQADTPGKRQILQTFINRIDLDGDDYRIEWSFLE
jgi:site-specific DNA recombinase